MYQSFVFQWKTNQLLYPLKIFSLKVSPKKDNVERSHGLYQMDKGINNIKML